MSKGIGLQSAPSSGLQPMSQEQLVMPFQVGEIISGKYEVHELIGAGGMGFVVSARHLELGEKVALKFLRPEALSNQELVGRFAREARASVKIKSEYVARVFDVGNLPDGAPFIVMEYLEGKDLADVLREEGPLPVKRAIEYVLQACEALAVAHAAGVVHRDVKPENLFLVQQSQGMDIVKVLDFGISKVALTGSVYETRMPAVKTMMPMGSPVYMSPEQVRAKRDIDARTDIWALGCTLYELLAGVAAFDAPSLTQITAAILESEPPSLQTLCSLVPSELEALVMQCLKKDPGQRFQNVAELAVALYPFGPRRARISAERCSYILHSAVVPQAEFELPSIPPPRFGATTGGGAAQPIVIEPDAETIGPEGPSFRSNKMWKGAALAAVVLALIAGAYAVFGRREPLAAPPPIETTQVPVATQAPPPAPAPVVNPAPSAPVDVIPSASQAATAVAVPPGKILPVATTTPAPRTRPVAQPRTREPRETREPKATASGRPAPSSPHEIDVGY
jgi:serine/threonine-protein kinase